MTLEMILRAGEDFGAGPDLRAGSRVSSPNIKKVLILESRIQVSQRGYERGKHLVQRLLGNAYKRGKR